MIRYNRAMTTISIEEILHNLPAYLDKVEAGETLIITRDDRAVAEIKPVASSVGQLRPFGLCAGEFTVPDDFDDPLPDEVLRQFEGE